MEGEGGWMLLECCSPLETGKSLSPPACSDPEIKTFAVLKLKYLTLLEQYLAWAGS